MFTQSSMTSFPSSRYENENPLACLTEPSQQKVSSSTKSRSSKDDDASQSTRNNSRKTVDDYDFLQETEKKAILGQGSYGTVRLAIDKQTGLKYAVKVMHKSSIFQFCTIENLKREIKIQKRMNHPNICKLFHYFEDRQSVYLVLEYAEQGSLFHNLRRAKKFTEDISFRFFYQTCLGIDHLHKNGIIHRDLKPENLLVDGKGDVKLCDFGWSAEQRNSIGRTTFCGTVDYMPPEMIGNQPHDHRVDIWCLGVLLYELIHGYAPFHGIDDKTKLRNIQSNQEVVFESFVPKDLESLIRRILQRNPNSRISMHEIFAHPWMAKFYRKFGIRIDSVLQQQDQNIEKQNALLHANSYSRSSLYSSQTLPSNMSSFKTQQSHFQNDRFQTKNLYGSFAATSNDSLQNKRHDRQLSESNLKQGFARQQSAEFGMHESNEKYYARHERFDSEGDIQARLQPIIYHSEEDEDFFEKLKRNSKISNEQYLKNRAEKQAKSDETFLDRILIAFGCVSRDKK